MRRSLAVLLVLLCAVSVRAEDWPSWRGPRLDGSSLEKNLPLKWSVVRDKKTGAETMDNIAWGVEIPGVGHSSPIVHGDCVFVTTCLLAAEKRVLLCLDRKCAQSSPGSVKSRPRRWNRFEHKLNSYSSSTPATDGNYVYTSVLRIRTKTDTDGPPVEAASEKMPRGRPIRFPEIVVAAVRLRGQQGVQEHIPGRFYSPHGFCSSPILYKDKVIVNGDQDAEAFIVALDKTTGAERWRINRPNRTRSYCVPLIVEAGGKTQMVLSGSRSVTSYNPDNGEPIWIIKGPTEQYVASLVYGGSGGLFFMTAGFPDYHNLTMIRPGQASSASTPPRRTSSGTKARRSPRRRPMCPRHWRSANIFT